LTGTRIDTSLRRTFSNWKRRFCLRGHAHTVHVAIQTVIVSYPTGKLFMAARRGTKDPDTAPSTGLSMLNRELPLTGPPCGANIRADGRRAMIVKSKLRTGLVVAAAVLAVAASSGRTEISKRDAQALSKTGLIYIATVRKDGNQSKAAPVWFTWTTSQSSPCACARPSACVRPNRSAA
jgi:hypothetical protein